MNATKAEMEAWDKGVEAHSLTNAGFCGYCGEACKPFHKLLPQELRDTACDYNGNHPDCGDHNMVFKEMTPEVLGSYEIHECTKCGWQDAF